MKLYIAGPMSGYPDHNFPAFNAMAKELRGLGFEVVNPAELAEDDSQPWEYYMRRDIPLLCQCDGIVLLPGWQQSRGACLEQIIARELDMPNASSRMVGFNQAWRPSSGVDLPKVIHEAEIRCASVDQAVPKKDERAAASLAKLLFPGKGKPVFIGDVK